MFYADIASPIDESTFANFTTGTFCDIAIKIYIYTYSTNFMSLIWIPLTIQ